MLSSVLVQLAVCSAAAWASAVLPPLPVDFYPVVDDAYLATPEVAPVVPQVAPVPIGYSGEQKFKGYEDAGARATDGQFSSGGRQSGYLDEESRKGSKGRESQENYDQSQRSQHKNQQDQGYYGDLSGFRSGYEDGRNYQGGQKFGQQARNSLGLGNRGGHKKGHTTTGFTNSYHKDETGKKSEFYDSSDDEGGSYLFRGQDQAFDGQGANAYQGGYNNNIYRNDNRGKQGHYGSGLNLADNKGHRNDYGRQEYYDQNRNYGHKAGQQEAKQLGGGYYDRGDRYSSGGGSSGHSTGGGTPGFYGGATASGTLGYHRGHSAAPYPYY
ncbi:keratin, type I cytoskeletal 9-like [Neocloeon triangulifer]|uniref:keratin, type I cytoskeletal 9-like n=1 Tax=Neocloeon triangulifer TaxID=2078957 RepID=UPI00286F826C|nr:keratin, type I cytoskeletal 9-like [Neocloeon triangulifer]